MILCFILMAVLVGIAVAFVCLNDNFFSGLIALILAAFLLFLGCAIAEDKADRKAIERLKDFNIEYLSDEQVYNTSKAELDKMYKIYTFSKTYYYEIEENN